MEVKFRCYSVQNILKVLKGSSSLPHWNSPLNCVQTKRDRREYNRLTRLYCAAWSFWTICVTTCLPAHFWTSISQPAIFPRWSRLISPLLLHCTCCTSPRNTGKPPAVVSGFMKSSGDARSWGNFTVSSRSSVWMVTGAQFEDLLAWVGARISRQDTNYRRSISAAERLFICRRWVAVSYSTGCPHTAIISFSSTVAPSDRKQLYVREVMSSASTRCVRSERPFRGYQKPLKSNLAPDQVDWSFRGELPWQAWLVAVSDSRAIHDRCQTRGSRNLFKFPFFK